MKPTTEQDKALALFAEGEGMTVQAGAGTGKTSTLKMIGASTQRRGQYVAFNRAIVVDAQKTMPPNVVASTMHSLAYKSKGAPMRNRLQGGRMTSTKIAQLLGVDPILVRYDDKTKVLQPAHLASTVMKAITNFCASADREPSAKHVPYLKGIDETDANGKRSWVNNNRVSAELEPLLAQAWADLQSAGGVLPYKHDHYLKAFELDSPKINADFIEFDEAQDASPVMESIVFQQTGAQIVVVGDSQQAIYEWRGAVDSLARFQEQGAASTMLTQSFRFGPLIADVANVLLDRCQSELRLRGTDSIPSTVAPLADADVDAVLCRTNARAVQTMLALQAQGRKVHLLGGGSEVLSFSKAAADLMAGKWTGHPELACFATWGEVQHYVDFDPSGDELKLLVNLIDEFGVETIIKALTNMPGEDGAVTISTAHKSKGREWNRVRLESDFVSPKGDGGVSEWRLLYVAATRAKHQLDATLCEPLNELLNPKPVLA